MNSEHESSRSPWGSLLRDALRGGVRTAGAVMSYGVAPVFALAWVSASASDLGVRPSVALGVLVMFSLWVSVCVAVMVGAIAAVARVSGWVSVCCTAALPVALYGLSGAFAMLLQSRAVALIESFRASALIAGVPVAASVERIDKGGSRWMLGEISAAVVDVPGLLGDAGVRRELAKLLGMFSLVGVLATAVAVFLPLLVVVLVRGRSETTVDRVQSQ